MKTLTQSLAVAVVCIFSVEASAQSLESSFALDSKLLAVTARLAVSADGISDDVVFSLQASSSPLSGNMFSLTVAVEHKFAGMTVTEILKTKKASIKDAELPKGSPSWDDIKNEKWEDIEKKAKANKTGYKKFKKLLTDKRFDK